MVSSIVELDDFLVIQLRKGNESAFERIFKLNYNQIVGFCTQFVNDRDKAKSLAQDSFIYLWTNREKIETRSGIKSFLYTHAKSGCLNEIRHQKVVSKYADKHLQEKEDQINREVLESFDFDSLEFSELENIVEQAISDLPERCQLVFRMSRLEGKKNQEIADELRLSVKSVEANITRALKTLKVNIAEYLPAIVAQLVIHFIS
jgi:RNA polymerase sigma-70 factor (ECF subfamily)